MNKNYFKWRNVLAIAICLTGITMFSACSDEKDENGTGQTGNGNGNNDGGGGNPGTWIAVANTTFSNFEIHDIAYGGGTFVAGDLNRAAYSSDGISWTAVKVFDVTGEYESEGFISIAYGGGRFVAIDNAGRVAYSTNGAAWTPANGTITAGADIAYGSNRFVACGASLSGDIAYSSNGEVWAESYNNAFSESYPTSNGIAYGAGKFVTVGDRGQMAYSTDGVTWNAVADSKFGQQKINGIDYCNDRFVAFGYASMAYSTDGITWTQVSIPNGSLLDKTDMKGVAYGGGKYVVVANKGKMAESPDCITWTEITETTFGYAEIYDITFGDGKFVAVGFNDTYRGHIAYCTVE
ncbi:MAG: hypothetical protein LBR81_04680 [Prevotellaceae bacterium]|jgi:hypothetical protein|nr:hypothetical protein [Prevotellaceae bacterium]